MNNIKQILTGILFLVFASSANAVPVEQYANSVIGYSSQYTSGNWAADQALGAPDTFAYGDIATAWAPVPRNGSLEYITLGYATAVYATGAVIRETYGNGFVFQVDVLDLNDIMHTVWSGTDTSVAGSPVDFQVNWSMTSYLIKGLAIYINTDHNLQAWEEIDSVLLQGNTAAAAVPEPGTLVLIGFGLVGMGIARRRKAA